MKHTYYSTKKSGDSDAYQFISAATILDNTQKSAIIYLVNALKLAGLWNKMKAIYPMIGGTNFSHRFNLKDPRQTSDAFFLNFVGNITHSSKGVKFNGSGYANTNLVPKDILAVANLHISFYSRTDRTGEIELEMGSQDGTKDKAIFLIFGINDKTYESLGNLDQNVQTQIFTPTTGHLILSRIDNDNIKACRGGSSRVISSPSTDLPTPAIFLGARNSNGVFGVYDLPSNKECAFASIGGGLNDDEIIKFQDIVQEYQVMLQREILDIDAQNFINAANLVNDNARLAVESLVTSLKYNGLYSKFKAIYPVIGGTINSHKYNLLDPRDSDDAYRLQFVNNPIHSVNGINWDGSSQYAKTFSGIDSSFDCSLSYFVGTTNTAINDVTIGCYLNGKELYLQTDNSGHQSVFVSSAPGYTIADKIYSGFHVGSTINGISYSYNNSDKLAQKDSNNGDYSISNIFLAALNNNGNPTNYTNSVCQFASIGKGLSENEIVSFSKIVNKFQLRARDATKLIVLESESRDFLTAAQITDNSIIIAINNLVYSLKHEGLWNKFKVLYPFAGYSFSSQKVNLINPSLFTLQENSNKPGYTSNGISFDGANNKALYTGFNPYIVYNSPDSANNYSSHIALYVTREDASTVQVDFGCGKGGYYFDLEPNIYGSIYYENPDGGMIGYSVPTAEGFTLGTRTSLNDVAIYKNGLLGNNSTNIAFKNYPDEYCYLGDRGGEFNYPSRRDYGFASIGDGLNATEVALLNKIIQAYQADLGRKKY